MRKYLHAVLITKPFARYATNHSYVADSSFVLSYTETVRESSLSAVCINCVVCSKFKPLMLVGLSDNLMGCRFLWDEVVESRRPVHTCMHVSSMYLNRKLVELSLV